MSLKPDVYDEGIQMKLICNSRLCNIYRMAMKMTHNPSENLRLYNLISHAIACGDLSAFLFIVCFSFAKSQRNRIYK